MLVRGSCACEMLNSDRGEVGWGVALSGHFVSEYLHFHFLPSNKSVDVDFRYMENWPQFHHLDM